MSDLKNLQGSDSVEHEIYAPQRRDTVRFPPLNSADDKGKAPLPCTIENETNKHAFTSGATSSRNMRPYHLIPVSMIMKVADRFGGGKIKHGDVNYQKSIKKDGGDLILDMEFARDRYNHGLHHLLNLKMTGSHKDDNIGAVLWFLSYAAWVEEHGFDWQRILNPIIVNETIYTINSLGEQWIQNEKKENVQYVGHSQVRNQANSNGI